MNRAKLILDLLNRNEDSVVDETKIDLNEEQRGSLDIDCLFPDEDLYKIESAPPPTLLHSPNNTPLNTPRSVPLLTVNDQDVSSHDEDKNVFKGNQGCVNVNTYKSNELKSPFSDITGINELNSSPIHDFSDSSVLWYPESDEERRKKKKRRVFISESSSSSDDEEFHERKRKVSHSLLQTYKAGSTQQSAGKNINTTNDTSIITGIDTADTSTVNQDITRKLSPIAKTDNVNLTRWKKSDPSKWKKNIAKKNKQDGLPYLGKQGQLMPAKQPKPTKCDDKCRYQCTTQFSEEERKLICENYWKITDFKAQKQVILDKIETMPVKMIKTNIPKNRTASYAYHFFKNDIKIRVCKDFFMKTLCISNGPINEALRHKDELGQYAGNDKRGSKGPVNETSTESQQRIIDHINSFPRLESHYCRKKCQRQFLDSKLTITKMYELYKEQLTSANEKPCSFYVYKKIFGTKFNLSFFKPKKDLCMICTRYDGAGRPNHLKEEYEAHILRKNKAQEAKELDKQRSIADDSYLVVTADMQSTLHIPVSGVGILYYTRKMNVQNFTIHTAKPPHEAFCITWNEINGKRGSVEIATAMNWWIEQLPSNIKDVTIYTDTCAGQNRNQFIAAFLAHLIQKPDLQLNVIEQKYLESGHTHMEVDSMHSAIERQQRYTPVFSMIDWKMIMRNARSKRHKDSAPPYVVKELTYNEMLDVRALNQTFVNNIRQDKDGKKIQWLKIKCLRFEKNNPGVVKFRYNHDGPYSELNMIVEEPNKSVLTRKRKNYKLVKSGDLQEKIRLFKSYVVPKAYSKPLPISEAKKRDLLNICQKGIIPQELHPWYKSLPSSKDVIDKILEPDAKEEGEDDVSA